MTEKAAGNRGPGTAGIARLIPDDRLARRAAAGDQRALGEVYRRYHQDLYRFCLAMVGSPEDAQDALQNTMVKVVRALPGEKRQIKLRPWLYRIARNESVETLRRRRDSVELQPELIDSTGDVAETAEERSRLRALIADLGELPERQRAVLVLRELSGLGFAEIGAAFDSSDSVARQTLYEARRSLRQMEAGREMSCDAVMRQLSDADGRVSRRRELRAHLRDCADCRAFRDAIAARRGDMAAIAPLPAAASAALLNGILGGGAGSAAGGAAGAGAGGGLAGAAGAAGAVTGKAVATSAIVKSAATVAVAAAVGASAADRGGLIDVPLGSRAGDQGAPAAPAARPATEAPNSGVAADGDGNRTGDRGQADGGGSSEPADGSRRDDGKGGKTRDNPLRPAKARGQDRGNGLARSKGGKRASGLPAASSHGRQTAGARKPAQASPSPGTPRTSPPAQEPVKPSPPPGRANENAPPSGGAEPPVKPPPVEPPPPAEAVPAPQGVKGKHADEAQP